MAGKERTMKAYGNPNRTPLYGSPQPYGTVHCRTPPFYGHFFTVQATVRECTYGAVSLYTARTVHRVASRLRQKQMGAAFGKNPAHTPLRETRNLLFCGPAPPLRSQANRCDICWSCNHVLYLLAFLRLCRVYVAPRSEKNGSKYGWSGNWDGRRSRCARSLH
jgi:hypothetical protein